MGKAQALLLAGQVPLPFRGDLGRTQFGLSSLPEKEKALMSAVEPVCVSQRDQGWEIYRALASNKGTFCCVGSINRLLFFSCFQFDMTLALPMVTQNLLSELSWQRVWVQEQDQRPSWAGGWPRDCGGCLGGEEKAILLF